MSDKTPPSAAAGKEVLYIDVDDEITGIIDKVRSSHQKIVALVLPKRATVFQSVVNMKLLKRAADAAKKNVVLISSEAGLMPLAGAVGLHVARNLQTRPEVPDGPGSVAAEDDSIAVDEDDAPAATGAGAKAATAAAAAVDKTRTVGELAGAAVLDEELDDTIQMGDEDEELADAPAAATPKKGKDKKLKVPNFNKFRMLIVAGALLLVGLIVFIVLAVTVLPKASITIKTDSSAVTSSTVATLKTGANVALDLTSGTVAATSQQTQKTADQQVPATGQQNNGTKATGTIKFYNCNKDDTLSGTNHTIPAGTGVTANGLTYITAQDVIVPPSHFLGTNCKQDVPSSTIGMTAQTGGAKYNQDATSYAVSGYGTITGSGAATTGGTDNIIKIVTQNDIDSAKQKLTAADTDTIKQDLKTGLINKGFFAVDITFNTGTPDVKTSANPGDTADTVTVTQTTTYTMLGVKQNDLQALIQNDVKGKLDLTKQKILDYGLSSAVFGLQGQNPDGSTVTMQVSAVVGSELNVNTIKQQVAGKKSGDAQSIIKQNPGVTEVTVTYSPFWVSSIPKKTGKITVTVQKPTAPSSSRNATNP